MGTWADERIASYRNEDLTADWEEAKERDRIEGDDIHQAEVLELVRTRLWFEKNKMRRKEGIARRTTKGRAPRGERAQVGRLVRAERVIAGMTLRQLARITGISRSALSRIETGHAWLSVARATVIADVLGLSLDAFRPALDQQARQPEDR